MNAYPSNNVVYNQCKSRLGVQQSWPRAAVTGRQHRTTCQAERERPSNPMNVQLFMMSEQIKKAGGEDALPQWSSVILTSLLLYHDVLHEETATGPQTALYSLCMQYSE